MRAEEKKLLLDAVDDLIVWRTVEHHLPLLLTEIEALLRAELAGPEGGDGA